MYHQHYHRPPERGGLLANLITLAAGAFVAYAVTAACLGDNHPAPTLEVCPAVILEECEPLDDQGEIDSGDWI